MRILYTLFAVLLFTASYATKYTVSNNPAVAAQFTDLQAAIDSASAGDEIYISGSVTNYGTITIAKSLTMYGEGYFSREGKMQTLLNEVHLQADNINLIGLTIVNYFNGTSADNANFVTVNRCRFTGGQVRLQGGSNYTFNNCVFQVVLNAYNTSGVIISNCIFNMGNSYAFDDSNSSSVYLSNNIFFSTTNARWFDNVFNATFSNNVFYQAPSDDFFYQRNESNNTFRNNVFNDNIDTAAVVAGGNILENNIFIKQDSILLNTTTYEVNPNNGLGTAATDGGVVGIYGGGSPMPNLRGTPNLPNVYDLTIQNAVIGPGEKLRVVVKARSED